MGHRLVCPAHRPVEVGGAPLNRAGRRSWRRLVRNRRGSAAVEFALVTPLLVGLLFGLLEVSMAMFTQSALQTAGRDVLRRVAVNTLPFAGAEAAIRAQVPSWLGNDLTITLNQTTPANPATNVYRVRLQAPMEAATPVALFTRGRSWSIQTEIEMKQELPFAESQS
ncbi:MAG: TadE/TadG family type IV pilus assembly protein [Sphingomonadaceae bacterium]